MMSTKPSLTSFHGKPSAKDRAATTDAARDTSTSPTSTISELGEQDDDLPMPGTRRRRVQTEKAAGMKTLKRPYRKTSDTFWENKKSKASPPETDVAPLAEKQSAEMERSNSSTSSGGSAAAGGEAMEAESSKASAGAEADVEPEAEDDVEMEEADANEASNALGLDDMPPPALPSNSITATADDQPTLPSSRAASEAPSNHSESSASVAAGPTPAAAPATPALGGRRAAATARKALSADKTEKKKVGRPPGIKKKKNAKLEVVEKVVNFEVIVHNDNTLDLTVSYLPTPFSSPTPHRPISILRQTQPSSTFTSYLYSIFPPAEEAGGVVSVEMKSRSRGVSHSQEKRLPTGKGRRLGLVVKDGTTEWVACA
ncbi:hypothetical protein MNV49_001190 [Pseudohyphozyma bogoriensis]|nr:hypothetical protein MNV49_001190 [Pseudohyphozyma bogoriensis]